MVGSPCGERYTGGGQHHVDAPSKLGKWLLSIHSSQRSLTYHFLCLFLPSSRSTRAHLKKLTYVDELGGSYLLVILPSSKALAVQVNCKMTRENNVYIRLQILMHAWAIMASTPASISIRVLKSLHILLARLGKI